MSTFAGMSGLESSSASLLLVYKSVLVCKHLFVEILGTKLIPVEILQRQPAVKVTLTKTWIGVGVFHSVSSLQGTLESFTASSLFRGLCTSPAAA